MSSFSAFDERTMRRALELATLGRYTTHPNPCVGCVIVQGERIVGEGWHRKWGEPHAEPLALAAAGDAAKGATVYVTLEPHSYHGRTPPCTDALIRAGVKRVICGALDSNPQVSGAGVAQMRAAGIEVLTGLLEAESHALNRGFDKRMRTGMPRVSVKIAASLDGRTALSDGTSKWITGPASRADVHRMRAESSAIVTGIGTVLADDPQLTVRDASIDLAGRIPLRVVLDMKLRLTGSARLFQEAGDVIVFTRTGHAGEAAERMRRLQDKGAHVEEVDTVGGHLDLRAVLHKLGEKRCNDVLVEAGATLSGRLVEFGLVDRLIVYIAPKLLGPDAKTMVDLPALSQLDLAPRFKLVASEQFDDDMKLVYEPS